jgi:hypothetical protein
MTYEAGERSRNTRQETAAKYGRLGFLTPAKVLAEIECRNKAKLSLKRADLLIEDRRLVFGAENHFGSLRRAIKKVLRGRYVEVYSQKGKGLKWTVEAVVADIERRYAEDKLSVTATKMFRTGSFRAVRRNNLFDGDWNNALAAANALEAIKASVPTRRFTTPMAVLAEIRKLAAAYVTLNPGKSEDPAAFKNMYRPLYRSGKDMFRTWPRAVTTAGIDYSRYLQYLSRQAYPVVRVKQLPYHFSLDEAVWSDSKRTRSEIYGTADPGFDQAENRLMLQAVLDKNLIRSSERSLLHQVISGQDLKDEEYELLASAVRAQPELLKMLGAV